MAATSMIVDHRNVGAAFRRLSLPLAVSMLGDQLLGIVDTIAIGSIGTVALAGVTGASAVFIAVIFAVSGFFSGVSIIAAQRIGARDLDGFARTVRAGFVIPMIAAILSAGLSLLFAEPLIGAMVGKLPSAHASGIYLTLRCFSLIPIVISGTLILGLGAAGNRTFGIYVLAIINIVHIPLLLVLALGWGSHHPLGIVGAGISSLISECIAAVYAIAYVLRRPIYRVFSSLAIDWRLAVETARLGFPEVVFLLAVVAPDIVIIAMLAPLGAITIAAFRALNVVSDLTFIVPSPLQAAAQTVIGQRLGAHDVAGARSFFVRARQVAFGVSTLTGMVVAILAWPLAYIFTLNPAVATLAALPLALHMFTLPLKGYAMVSIAPIRASGDTRFSMFAGLVCSAFVLPITWYGIEIIHIGLYSVPIAWTLAWLARGLLTSARLRGDDWTRREPIRVD